MEIEMDFWTWLTGLIVAAHIVAIIGMIFHAAYLRRKERTRNRRTSVRHRN